MSVAPVQVATVQTVARRLGKIQHIDPDLIIVDEGHHSVAGTWCKALDAFPKAKLFFCTATPLRLDGKGLGKSCGGFSDCLIKGPSIKNLTARGFLTKPVVYAPPVGIDLSGIHVRAGDFAKDELEVRIDKRKIVGNVIEHYKRICPGQRAMAFCVSVKHAERVAEEFNLAGIPAASIDGTMSDQMRESRLFGLHDLKYQVLTSCELVNEGIDIPAVSVAILLRPTMSLGLYMQQVGRCVRPFQGKTETIVLDHVGNCFRHGLPDEDRDWSLEGIKKPKKKKDEKIIRFRTCPKCYLIYSVSTKICPQCGTEYTLSKEEIKQIQGELQRVEQIQEQYKQKNEVYQARTLEALIALGKSRGYKYARQWAERIVAARANKRKSFQERLQNRRYVAVA